MYQNTDELKKLEETDIIILFRTFAEEGLEPETDERVSQEDPSSRLQLRIKANEYDSRLLEKQFALLSTPESKMGLRWAELDDYLEKLRFAYREKFITKRLV